MLMMDFGEAIYCSIREVFEFKVINLVRHLNILSSFSEAKNANNRFW